MQISITDHEASILKQSLKSNVMAKGILDKISRAEETQEEIKNCKHKWGKYTGKKECCVHCGAFDIGMGEDWTLKE